jgi:hypothetical protein
MRRCKRRENFGAWVRGMISFVEMVNPRQGNRLREQLDAVKD